MGLTLISNSSSTFRCAAVTRPTSISDSNAVKFEKVSLQCRSFKVGQEEDGGLSESPSSFQMILQEFSLKDPRRRWRKAGGGSGKRGGTKPNSPPQRNVVSAGKVLHDKRGEDFQS